MRVSAGQRARHLRGCDQGLWTFPQVRGLPAWACTSLSCGNLHNRWSAAIADNALKRCDLVKRPEGHTGATEPPHPYPTMGVREFVDPGGQRRGWDGVLVNPGSPLALSPGGQPGTRRAWRTRVGSWTLGYVPPAERSITAGELRRLAIKVLTRGYVRFRRSEAPGDCRHRITDICARRGTGGTMSGYLVILRDIP